MVQVTAPVVIHRRIARDHYRMRVKAHSVARAARPGQFIHLRCGSGDYPLLRRPFSLLDADPRAGTIDFIYKVVGLGTQVLREIAVGSKVDLLGPLGSSFEIPAGLKRAVLVGGGVGIPPLYFLAKEMVKGRGSRVKGEIRVYLGARTKGWVLCASDFRRLGLSVEVATDDGSLGHHGSVVDLLKRFLPSTIHHPPSTLLFLCGPTPMMAAAAALAHRENWAAQASLEERMGCAMGCCMGCVVEIATEPVSSHARFQRVCTEGPVFPAEVVVWR